MSTKKVVACRSCGQRLRIPMDLGILIVHCPKCGHDWEWADRWHTIKRFLIDYRQNLVLVVGALSIILMLMVPPVGSPEGYALFFDRRNRPVHAGLLLVQWIGVSLVVTLLYGIFRPKPSAK